MLIEQFLPALHYGDAVGNHCLSLHEFFLSQGIDSRIIACTVDDVLKDKAILFEDYKESGKESIKILHFAVASPLTDYFIEVKAKKAMIYHNVTPEYFFVDYDPFLVKFVIESRKHLERLSKSFDLVIAVSRFNAMDLEKYGYSEVKVFPVMLKNEDYSKEHSKAYFELFNDERKNILFVGRMAPNKKIEDLIKLLYFYKNHISPSIRLILAGNTKSVPVYTDSIMDFASSLFLTTEDVFFTSHIPFEELLALYRLADVFVSMSEHEGFCVPLLECAHFNLPVVAYSSSAVSETLGEGGILFKDKDYPKIAFLIHKIIKNQNLRNKLREKQERNLKDYLKKSQPKLFLDILLRKFK